MSASITCDLCGTTLVLKSNGEDEGGEIHGWVKVSTSGFSGDACTRSCAHLLLDKFGEQIDAHAVMLSELAHEIAEERAAEGGDRDG